MQHHCQCRLFLILSLTAAMLLTSQAEKSPNVASQSSEAAVGDVAAALAADGKATSSNVKDKRDWNQMQGLWGKRSLDSENNEDDDLSEAEVKRSWSDLTRQGWGKRAWNQMQGLWGKRSSLSQDQDETESMAAYDDDDISQVKRAWNQLQGVWGKRAWNQMQGLWGKRSAPQEEDYDQAADKRAWNQMQGVWGKRSADDSINDEMVKRSLSAIRPLGKRELLSLAGKGKEWSRKRETGWNNLKGLWG